MIVDDEKIDADDGDGDSAKTAPNDLSAIRAVRGSSEARRHGAFIHMMRHRATTNQTREHHQALRQVPTNASENARTT
ncbi:uncharacterized protein VTP21DRAFT_6909 [Calcarisporiella thermophila]|uniref:uncharacterized protein n=1 Tax=Calcarisporiella thermophila TaxID=911321 RepID=UPI0037424303